VPSDLNVQSNREAYEGANMYDQTGFLKNRLTSARSTDFKNAQYRSSYYVQNASFVRMDNISLGYTFNKLFMENDDDGWRYFTSRMYRVDESGTTDTMDLEPIFRDTFFLTNH
jgi:hypothetical protein